MGKRKILRRFERDFGAVPNVHYFAGDMENITSYFDFRRDNHLDDFLLDETTWYDLDMDAVFKHLNPGLTTSGEQYLYYMLRHPAVTKEDYDSRRSLISLVTEATLRLKLQYILYKLGKSRNAVMGQAFNPEYRGSGWLVLFTCLSLMLLISVVLATFFFHMAAIPAVVLFLINITLHSRRIDKLSRDYETVNYSFSMINALNKIRKLKVNALDAMLSNAYESLDRFKSALRMGSIPVFASNAIAQIALNGFLLDLIAYEFLKNKLWRNHGDLFTIHEHLGKLDAAIAIASYKKSIPHLCEPEIDFSGSRDAFIEAVNMAHPMIEKPILNDLNTSEPVLITGSNASGKSTYLKTAAVCAVLAQSICVTTAKCYRASAFRIFSSMAITDDLTSGESYYIVEIKSLKRIFDAAESTVDIGKDCPILAVIDEVLRGTNTVERIAASTEVLNTFRKKGILCLVATHDIELCKLLDGKYRLFHFEEKIGSDAMIFDYKIKPGPATSRNAINLLKLLCFDNGIVERAYKRANSFLETGVWTQDSN